TGAVYGIYNNGGAAATNLTVTGNTVDRITGVSFSAQVAGITNQSSTIGGTLNLNNNAIGTTTGTYITTTASSGGALYAMYNSNGASTAIVNMQNNTVDGFNIYATSVNLTTMACNGANVKTADVSNNTFGNSGNLITFSGPQPSTGTFRVIDLGTGSSNALATINCQSNSIKNITYSVTGAGTVSGIFINSTPLSATIQSNTFTNLILNTTDNVWVVLDIASRASGQSLTVTNNSIITGLSKTAGPATIYGEHSFGASVNGSALNITNNNFSNITAVSTTTVYGVNASDGASNVNGSTKTITGNTINNLVAGTGTVYGVQVNNSAAATVSSNTLTNFSSNGSTYGINIGTNNGQGTVTCASNTISNHYAGTGSAVGIYGGVATIPQWDIYSNNISALTGDLVSFNVSGIYVNAGALVNVYSNTVSNLSSSAALSTTMYGIYAQNSTTVNVYRNKIYSMNLINTYNGSPVITGLYLVSGITTANAYNNFVANLTAPQLDGSDGIRGISVASGTASSTTNLYYNSVYLNASSTGTNFGTSGIYHQTSATATTGALNMIDNIIVNTSTPNGTGKTAAYRRSDATLTNYISTSDYNLFYAGTPSASRLIFYDGTNSDQTLAAYQTRVSPRDANSISSLPTFTSTTDLHLTGANCSIDGRGTPISITDDIDLQTRDAATPDMGADEFTATYNNTLAGVAGSAVCENKTVAAS
ncbi:MAG TPA: hypothetical protein VKH37_10235, partial [Ferruginibacter sp.]|nr:hypothetical protein [Ferruginibacter sp.]